MCIRDSSKDRLEAVKHLYRLSQGNILILFDDGELYALAGASVVVMQANGAYYLASEVKAFSDLLKSVETAKVIKPKADSGVLQLNSSANFIGDWDEQIVKEGDFMAVKYASCDFCGSYGYCQSISIEGKTYDRCYDCFRANKTQPIRRVVYSYSRESPYYYNRAITDYGYSYQRVEKSHSSKSKRKKGLKCCVCGAEDNVYVCTICGRAYCLECVVFDECIY